MKFCEAPYQDQRHASTEALLADRKRLPIEQNEVHPLSLYCADDLGLSSNQYIVAGSSQL